MRFIVLLATSLSVSGCGYYQAQQGGDAALDAEVLLLGASKQEIKACAGEPLEIRDKSTTSETWHYQYDYYKYNPTDVNYIGFADIIFSDGEVIEVKLYPNRDSDSIGIPLTERQAKSISWPIVEKCAV